MCTTEPDYGSNLVAIWATRFVVRERIASRSFFVDGGLVSGESIKTGKSLGFLEPIIRYSPLSRGNRDVEHFHSSSVSRRVDF